MWSITLCTIFVSEKVPGPFWGPFLYLSHGPASSKNKKNHGLKNSVPLSLLLLKKLDVDLSISLTRTKSNILLI